MKTFISYARNDSNACKQLRIHLEVLRKERLIDLWYDLKMPAGAEFDRMINEKLESSDLFLFLVSPDFLNSGPCCREMCRALERQRAGEASVIPIILRLCDWQNSPLGEFQALPDDAKPIIQWKHKDEAYFSVVKGIRELLETTEAFSVRQKKLDEFNKKFLEYNSTSIFQNKAEFVRILQGEPRLVPDHPFYSELPDDTCHRAKLAREQDNDPIAVYSGCSQNTPIHWSDHPPNIRYQTIRYTELRSEERRVGKECRFRWSPYH